MEIVGPIGVGSPDLLEVDAPRVAMVGLGTEPEPRSARVEVSADPAVASVVSEVAFRCPSGERAAGGLSVDIVIAGVVVVIPLLDGLMSVRTELTDGSPPVGASGGSR